MNKPLILITLLLLFSCNSPREYSFSESHLNFIDISKYQDDIYFSDELDKLYKLDGDSIISIPTDSIVTVKSCLNKDYALHSINDSTLLLINPDNSQRKITNRTDLQNKYFKIQFNEKCELLLENSSVFFSIQDNNYIDYDKAYGFSIRDRHGLDRYGFYDNFIFMTKYPDYFRGGFFKTYLDSSKHYQISDRTKVRDFIIHKGALWMSLGYYDNIDGEVLIETQLMTLQNGKIKEESEIELPSNFDISTLFSDGQNLYVLSEQKGFYQIKNNELELLISINLKNSGITPESFFVDSEGTVYLTTWEHGVLIISGSKDEYDIRQVNSQQRD